LDTPRVDFKSIDGVMVRTTQNVDTPRAVKKCLCGAQQTQLMRMAFVVLKTALRNGAVRERAPRADRALRSPRQIEETHDTAVAFHPSGEETIGRVPARPRRAQHQWARQE
jgi:hypothetical protein